MSILNHVWGVSSFADRVWAQVAGMDPNASASGYFVVLQAYIDDSADADGNYVLAGHVADVASWVAFSKEWAELLPRFGTLKQGTAQYHFKMNEMNYLPERRERVSAFFRVIEKHILLSVSCSFRLSDMRRAMARITCPGHPINYGDFRHPFVIAYRGLMDGFHQNRDLFGALISANEQVDFYFDNQSEKKIVIGAWDDYIFGQGANIMFGATPRFEDDTKFLPLQAADLWAWWVRKWRSNGASPAEMLRNESRPDRFPFKVSSKGYPLLDIWLAEDDMAKFFQHSALKSAPPDSLAGCVTSTEFRRMKAAGEWPPRQL